LHAYNTYSEINITNKTTLEGLLETKQTMKNVAWFTQYREARNTNSKSYSTCV